MTNFDTLRFSGTGRTGQVRQDKGSQSQPTDSVVDPKKTRLFLTWQMPSALRVEHPKHKLGDSFSLRSLWSKDSPYKGMPQSNAFVPPLPDTPITYPTDGALSGNDQKFKRDMRQAVGTALALQGSSKNPKGRPYLYTEQPFIALSEQLDFTQHTHKRPTKRQKKIINSIRRTNLSKQSVKLSKLFVNIKLSDRPLFLERLRHRTVPSSGSILETSLSSLDKDAKSKLWIKHIHRFASQQPAFNKELKAVIEHAQAETYPLSQNEIEQIKAENKRFYEKFTTVILTI